MAHSNQSFNVDENAVNFSTIQSTDGMRAYRVKYRSCHELEADSSARALDSRTGNSEHLEMIRLIGIVIILVSIFMFGLALIISEAEAINAFGESLGIPRYHDSTLNH